QEVDKLIAEWEPEPLVEPIPVTTQSLLCPPIIIGIPDVRPKILTVTNLASINFTGVIGDKRVK
ncbi:hypothetical protein PPACK8108_LOCUS15453, partial [Phakopsora pachyrhizi]